VVQKYWYGNILVSVKHRLTHDQETQDLGQLVLLCREFDPAAGTDYPVDVVVKSPFMAMRYPKTFNTVRTSFSILSFADPVERFVGFR
jgi:hypothetical protein